MPAPTLDAFLATLQTDRTRRAYGVDVRQFLNLHDVIRLGELRTRPADAIRTMVEAYRDDVSRRDEAGAVTNPRTVHRKISAVRMFLKWLTGVGGLVYYPADLGPLPSLAGAPKGGTLSRDELRSLLRVPDRATLRGARDYAILMLLTGCALRRSEVARLRVSDVKVGFVPTLTVGEAEADRREVPLTPAVGEALESYFRTGLAAGLPLGTADAPLFTGADLAAAARRRLDPAGLPTALTGDAVWRIVRQIARTAGVEGHVTPHAFRQAAIALAIQGGASYVEVQGLTGHRSAATVARYDRTPPNRRPRRSPFVDLGSPDERRR